MTKRLIVLVLPLLVVACASSDDDAPVYQPRSRPAPRAEAAALDMLPPADWWHQPQIAGAVNLTADQMIALDKIAQDQGNDVSRIETDMTIAMRDLRSQLDAAQPAQADIIAAGQRIRALRDSIFDRQLQMLAAERTVLSLDQWHTLEQQLRDQRQQRMQDQGYPRRRGMGGRGRWPGY